MDIDWFYYILTWLVLYLQQDKWVRLYPKVIIWRKKWNVLLTALLFQPSVNAFSLIVQSYLWLISCSAFSEICPHCNIALEPLSPIREDQFVAMRQAFIDQVFHRKGDVYLTTTPRELDKFVKFLHHSGHFDVIIDGLNVSYNTKRKVTVKQRAEVVSWRSDVFIMYQWFASSSPHPSNLSHTDCPHTKQDARWSVCLSNSEITSECVL